MSSDPVLDPSLSCRTAMPALAVWQHQSRMQIAPVFEPVMTPCVAARAALTRPSTPTVDYASVGGSTTRLRLALAESAFTSCGNSAGSDYVGVVPRADLSKCSNVREQSCGYRSPHRRRRVAIAACRLGRDRAHDKIITNCSKSERNG
jgi:hypothetical protein